MTTLTLTKHHGLGNDFLVVFDPDVDDLNRLARRLCDRRTGVGADGLLVALQTPQRAAQMLLFNADGSRAEMSGNGIRCLAQAIAARRGELAAQLIKTDAGDRLVSLQATTDEHVVQASVDMGEVCDVSAPSGWSAVQIHPDRPVAHLSVGNAHTVVGVDDVGAVDLAALGPKVPGVNLEVIEPGPESDAITMRVHERGAGITAACGTGAVAAAVAARRWGFVDTEAEAVRVHMDGGDAVITLDRPSSGRATLSGPATFVASIDIEVT